VARWFRSGLSVSGPLVCRCLIRNGRCRVWDELKASGDRSFSQKKDFPRRYSAKREAAVRAQRSYLMFSPVSLTYVTFRARALA
jgi:hypothetical protein